MDDFCNAFHVLYSKSVNEDDDVDVRIYDNTNPYDDVDEIYTLKKQG